MSTNRRTLRIPAMLICAALALGSSTTCILTIREGQEITFPGFFVWLASVSSNESPVKQTDSKGNEVRETPALEGSHPEQGAALPPQAADATSQLSDGSPPKVAQSSPNDPRVILVGGTTAQILNVGTNTVGPSVELTGRFAVRVAASSDAAFAAVVVGQFDGPGGVDLVDVATMTRTGTISLPLACEARDIAFVPGTHDFAVACSGDGTVRFYSVSGGAGPIREFPGCDGVRVVAFTADGQRGLFSCETEVWVYDVLSDSVVHSIEGFSDVLSMATSMDATRAYVGEDGDGGGKLKVINLATYDVIRTTDIGTFPSTISVSLNDQRVYILAARDVRGVDVADREGVLLDFVPAPAFPISVIVVPAPASI